MVDVISHCQKLVMTTDLLVAAVMRQSSIGTFGALDISSRRRIKLKVQTLFEFVESLDGLQTEEEFLEHAKSVVQPAIEKYRAIFVAEGGDHVELKRAMDA
jgi:hypothetical protein